LWAERALEVARSFSWQQTAAGLIEIALPNAAATNPDTTDRKTPEVVIENASDEDVASSRGT
jgi:hypothetical protein